MAFTTGTATDQNDLLDKLRLYLVAQGWTELAWSAGATVNDSSVLHVRGPGAGAGKQVFVSVKTQAGAIAGYYSWELRGAVDYDSGAAWGAQLGQSPTSCYLNLWSSSITYWFFVNDRRFIVVAKCSTNYMSAHCGFILPWGTPADYPFPLYIAGDFYELQPYSYSYAARRMFVDPGNYTQTPGDARAGGYARTATGVWYPIGNHSRSANNNYPQAYSKGQRGISWPYHAGGSYGLSLGAQYYPHFWNGGTGSVDAAYAFEALVPTQQGERPLLPVMLCPGDQSPLGVLDGVYCTGGTGLATEQLISIGARDFRVFQNIARNSPDDFFCVEEA